jgi:transcriptional regulator with XRE-family HTH domain
VRIKVGARIRAERKAKKFSQADLERRCGLARCRISWLEHGRAVPTIETLERIADALEIPAHRLLLDVEDGGEAVVLPQERTTDDRRVLVRKGRVRAIEELRKCLSRISEEDKLLLVFIAQKMAGRFAIERGRRKKLTE